MLSFCRLWLATLIVQLVLDFDLEDGNLLPTTTDDRKRKKEKPDWSLDYFDYDYNYVIYLFINEFIH